MSGQNDADEHRNISFDGSANTAEMPASEFCDNYVRTTKYTLATFLPKNLFEQFKKKANFYFLIIAILSTTPISPKRPEVSILPLMFVLTVSAIKEAFEDYARYKMDQDVNNSLVLQWNGSAYEDVRWQDVRVGGLLLVKEDGSFPCDILLLHSSGHQGMCNIETANLDGETNLKIKKAVAATYNRPCAEDGSDYAKGLKVDLICSIPNERMDKTSWNGNLMRFESRSDPVPVGMTQMLLRGCTLRNTKWIIGLVVFTGVETKLMLNNKATAFKRSNVERTVDKALYVIFTIQASLCLFGAIGNAVWLQANWDKHSYLRYTADSDLVWESVLSYLTYLVLLDLLVPISLYVSMELVKFAQAWLINADIAMYDPVSNTPAKARTSNLNEELGQVDYIFSDKTGTLTQNKMEFLRCSIAGVKYGPGEMHRANDVRNPAASAPGMPSVPASFRFHDDRVPYHLKEGAANARELALFLELLSVCHTVICEPGLPGSDSVEYQAASPDERALVIAAKNLGYYFKERQASIIRIGGNDIDGQTCTVCIDGVDVVFEVLSIIEFNSTRKRMSTVVRDTRDASIKIFCKGADNVIYDRLSLESRERDWGIAEKHLEEYAKEGLRTLCCGVRIIDEQEFHSWYSALKDASSALEEREAKIIAVGEQLEKEFSLIGCTAIEDRLQDGVPECIATLAKANIKIWVLTGDKVETAINIGRSCRLLTKKMSGDNLIVIDIDEKLADAEAEVLTIKEMEQAWEKVKDYAEGSDELGLVISGKALGFMFPVRRRDAKGREIPPTAEEEKHERKLQLDLLQLCRKCAAVVCCRVSPKQKAQMVSLVRTNVTGAITLSIGDGANDVSMIKEAHVGIGISGQEGLQAVMASDYALAQFRFLTQLLLVHGSWSYRRISLLINYSFYKNITISLCQMLFAFYNGFSGQVFYDPFTGSMFNMFFTAAPVIMLATFNRDVSAASSRVYPLLYTSGQNNEYFNLKLLTEWIVKGAVHALIIFFFGISVLAPESLDSSGRVPGLWIASSSVYMSMLLVVSVMVALETTTWVFWSYFFFFGSWLLWFFWLLAYTNVFATPDMFGVGTALLGTGRVWLLLPIILVACIGPEICLRHVFAQLRPTLIRIVQEREKSPQEFAAPVEEKQKEDTIVKLDDRSKALARQGSGGYLGFVPFQQSETQDDFVMGQREYIQETLKSRKSSDQNSSAVPAIDS